MAWERHRRREGGGVFSVASLQPSDKSREGWLVVATCTGDGCRMGGVHWLGAVYQSVHKVVGAGGQDHFALNSMNGMWGQWRRKMPWLLAVTFIQGVRLVWRLVEGWGCVTV